MFSDLKDFIEYLIILFKQWETMKKNEQRFSPLSLTRMKMMTTTKGEIYSLLKHSGNYYLPPNSQSDWGFIHDIMVE